MEGTDTFQSRLHSVSDLLQGDMGHSASQLPQRINQSPGRVLKKDPFKDFQAILIQAEN